MTDGTEFPWAETLDGVWHLRPPSDQWTEGDVQAHGLCGAAFASVHVSTVQPTDSLCPDCPTR